VFNFGDTLVATAASHQVPINKYFQQKLDYSNLPSSMSKVHYGMDSTLQFGCRSELLPYTDSSSCKSMQIDFPHTADSSL